MSEMSSSQDCLKMKLDQLECHFTWDLNKDDLDLHNLPSRLEEQVRLDLSGAARALCSIGYVKFLLEHTQEALTNLLESERLVKENPNCEKSLIVTYGNLAWVYFHRENFPKCQSYLEKLEEIKETLQTKPSSVPEVLHEKGWAFLRFSHDNAVEVFQKAVELYPNNSELNAGYAHALYRTEPGISCIEDAVNQLRQAIKLNPDDAVLKVLLAIKLVSRTKSFMNEAEKLVETALNDSPEHPHVMRYVGKFFRNHGSVEKAIEILKKALKSTNSCFIHHQLGLCYKTKKINLSKEKQSKTEIDKTEIDEARNQSIYHLEKATQLKPSFVIAMSALAVQYGERGDLKEAEELFKKAFETARENNEHLNVVNFDYAWFQQYSKKSEDSAIKHYKECWTMYPHTGEGKKSAWKLKGIAQKHISHNPNDQKAKEILELLQQPAKGDVSETKCARHTYRL